MGEAPEGLVVVELSQQEGSNSIQVSGKEYYVASVGQVLEFTWMKNFDPPKIEIQEAEAQIRLLSGTRVPIDEEPISRELPQYIDLHPLDAKVNPSYLWDQAGKPMVLLLMPLSTSLMWAHPKPAGVWRNGDRICAFWQEPRDERKIEFRIGDKENSLEANVHYWQKEIAPSAAQVKFAHPIITLIAFLALVAAIIIILILRFGEVAAAGWVGAGGTLAGVLVVIGPPLLRQRPKTYKTPRKRGLLMLWRERHA